MTPVAARRFLFYVEQNYCFNILRPIQRVLRDRGDEVRWLPVGNDFDRSALSADEPWFQSAKQAVDWSPCAVFVPGNFVPRFIPGVKVMVTHGLLSEKRRKKDGLVYSFIERGLFDLYITHGPNTTARWEEMARAAGYFEVAECGWPKLDPLFDGTLVKTPSSRPVIYFASTFSPRLAAAPRLVETVRQLVAEQDWQWLVHFHSKMPPGVTQRYRDIQSDRLCVVEGHDTLPLLFNADAMLCDTSSIISEFCLLRKPVVTYRNLSPQPYMIDVTRPQQVGPALERALARPPEIMRAIEQHARETHPWTDGRSSERVVAATDQLVDRGLGHLRRKPRNLIRHWKMRRDLNYYRFF